MLRRPAVPAGAHARGGANVDLRNRRCTLRVSSDCRDLERRELQRRSREGSKRGDRRPANREGGGYGNDVTDREREGAERDQAEGNAPAPKRKEAEPVSCNYAAVRTVCVNPLLPSYRGPPLGH